MVLLVIRCSYSGLQNLISFGACYRVYNSRIGQFIQPQNQSISHCIRFATSEVVERKIGYLDNMLRDKRSPFDRPLFRTLKATFPFQNSPAVKSSLNQQGKHTLEIDLPVPPESEIGLPVWPMVDTLHRHPTAQTN